MSRDWLLYLDDLIDSAKKIVQKVSPCGTAITLFFRD